jgi:hypothetical protein
MSQLSARGLKLSMIILPGDPAYITVSGNAQTWTHGTVVKPRPWDQYTIDRYAAFLQALSAHPVPDPAQGGAPVALKDHSLFYALNITLPGVPNGGIRDKEIGIIDIPGYTRDLFIENAVIKNLANARAAFPARYLSIGFWSSIKNDGQTTPLWQAVHDRILSEFDGVNKRKVGVFMDNLAAKRACAGCSPYTGAPTIEYASSLYTMQDVTFTSFQALTSWKTASTQPVGPNETQADKVRYGTPMDGIEYALQNFDSRYVELYVDDVDNLEWQPGLSGWATTLRSSP